jgi:hypothetical protein
LLAPGGALDTRHALMRESKRAAALYGEGKLNEGEQLAMTTFKRAQEIPDCEDPLLHSIGVLVDIYLKTERLDEAHRFVSLMVDRKNLIVAQGVIPYCIRLIADGYAKQRSVKAIALYEEAIVCAEQVQGRNPELLDQCLSAYGEYCFANGLKDKAYRNSEKLLDFRKNIYGRNSAHYAIALAIRARLVLRNDFVLADESSKEALEIVENLSEENDHCLKIALETRCLVLKQTQRLEEHKELEKRLDQLRNKTQA